MWSNTQRSRLFMAASQSLYAAAPLGRLLWLSGPSGPRVARHIRKRMPRQPHFIKFNLMAQADCEPTSASCSSATNRHVDRVFEGVSA
jgi:hypothetical protein